MQPIYQDFAVTIYRFGHSGPSRSGEATITVTILDSDEKPDVTISYTHHEGTCLYDVESFAEAARVEEDTEWKQDLADINRIIVDIVTNHKRY